MDKILGAIIAPHPPIIVPEIGKAETINAKDTIESMEKIADIVDSLKPETIVLVSPHGNAFRDAMNINAVERLYGDFSNFGNFNLKFEFENDLELAEKIHELSNKSQAFSVLMDEAFAKDFNITTKLDHGALVPLYFIDKKYKDFKLVSITYGMLEPKALYEFGKAIKEAAILVSRKTLFIASGDLSHRLKADGPYGYDPSGPIFDKKIEELISNSDFEGIINFDKNISEPAGECGLKSFQTMAGFLDGLDTKVEIFSNEGPFGVGYMVAFIEIRNSSTEDEFIKLARQSIENFVNNKTVINYSGSNEELLNSRAGAFVSIYKSGQLRGCIGTFLPTKDNLAAEIISNAISAATKDPRFPVIDSSELKDLKISVDILSEPEKINSIDELDVKKYGIIVSKAWRRGLLLPNLDGVDTVEMQIAICKQKAGISIYDDDIEIEKFKVCRHE